MMRNIMKPVLLTAIVGCLFAGNLYAQDIKVGYIDSQRIFAEYKETQDAEKLYKKEVDAWKIQAETMEREIVKLQDELKAQSLMLSEEKQKEKKLILDQKIQDYQRFMAETFGDEGIAAKRNKELTQPIVEKINRILQTMAEEQDFAVVFDIANASIVYAKKEYDLTDLVLVELRKIGQ